MDCKDLKQYLIVHKDTTLVKLIEEIQEIITSNWSKYINGNNNLNEKRNQANWLNTEILYHTIQFVLVAVSNRWDFGNLC